MLGVAPQHEKDGTNHMKQQTVGKQLILRNVALFAPKFVKFAPSYTTVITQNSIPSGKTANASTCVALF